MTDARERFGQFVRRRRCSSKIGLRQMAKRIGISPTYLSKVERDEFPPPAEERVREIAKIIGCNADELLARAGRVSSDLADIIKDRPVQLAALLRCTKDLPAAEIADMVRHWERKARGKCKQEDTVTAFEDADRSQLSDVDGSDLHLKEADRA
jgi:transcriptional regulator with XRE-family HTH domain